MENLELQCFQIISFSGAAKSNYIEAMRVAREFNFEKAKELIEEGKKQFKSAQEAHAVILNQNNSGEKIEFNMILMHAEDHLMAADSFRIMCEENIELLKLIKEKI